MLLFDKIGARDQSSLLIPLHRPPAVVILACDNHNVAGRYGEFIFPLKEDRHVNRVSLESLKCQEKKKPDLGHIFIHDLILLMQLRPLESSDGGIDAVVCFP